MGEVRVHHLGLSGGAAAFAAAVRLAPAPPLDLGFAPLPLFSGPNLYLSPGEGDGPPAPRPVNAPGIAHLCLQSRDGEAARAALEGAGVSFLSPPVALGTGFLYAYARDPAGALAELESAPFLPESPPAWFGHIAFVSRDAERLAGFYAALLGAEVVAGGRFRDNPRIDAVAGLDGVDVEVWWVRAGGFALEFWRYRAPPAPDADSARWYGHLGLETDDLTPALAELREAKTFEGPDGRAAWAKDPDGNRLLLIELAPHVHDRSVAALPDRDILARAAAARAAA